MNWLKTISSEFIPRALTGYEAKEKKVMQCHFKCRIILDDLSYVGQSSNTYNKYTIISPPSKPVSAE